MSRKIVFVCSFLAVLLALTVSGASAVTSIGTSITYHGSLLLSGIPVNKTCDFQFGLWNASSSGTRLGAVQTVTSVKVVNGWYTVQLNSSNQFGTTAFNGEARWLGVSVRCPAGSGSYVALSPRLLLAAVPYAQYSTNANLLDGQHGSYYQSATNLNAGTLSTSRFSAYSDLSTEGYLGNAAADLARNNGVLQATLNADMLDGFHVSSFIQPGQTGIITSEMLLDGAILFADWASNGCGSGQIPKWNGSAWACGDDADSADADTLDGQHASVFALSSHNHDAAYVNEDQANSVTSSMIVDGTVAFDDWASNGCASGQFPQWNGLVWICATSSTEADTLDGQHASAFVHTSVGADSFVGGGVTNTASGNRSVVGGGLSNTASGHVSFIGGGTLNQTALWASTVSGGEHNTANGTFSSVGGGYYNVASGWYAAVPGGYYNTAAGDNSLAAGFRAKANHHGSFVWADGTTADFASIISNEFAVRASGGVRFVTSGGGMTVDGSTAWHAGNDGASSGLDADLLDGYQASDFATSSHNHNADYVNEGQADSVTSTMITDGTVAFADWNSNGCDSGQVSKWNGSAWACAGDDAGSADADTLDGQHASAFWLVGGNTVGTTAVLGTADNNPVELWANGSRALRIEPRFNTPNIIGGYNGNSVTDGMVGATISGGGLSGKINQVTSGYGTVGGGFGNTAGGDATVGGGIDNTASGGTSTVGGGVQNTASGDSVFSHTTVGGGMLNTASGYGSTVGGGEGNTASGDASVISGGGGNIASSAYSTVAGGGSNESNGIGAFIGGGGVYEQDGDIYSAENYANGESSVVGGGYSNYVEGNYAIIGGGTYNHANGNYAVVSGGSENYAYGDYSFVSGFHTYNRASDDGVFLFADSSDVEFASSADNEFAVRSTGGVRFVSAIDESGTPTAGVTLASGGGSWSSLSDRALKANFTAVDGDDILAAIASLPISTWNYKAQAQTIRHIGPMAQDFYTAFGVGEDDTHITSVDADGVALAGIQALYRQNRQLEARLAALEGQGASLAGPAAGLVVPLPWLLFGGLLLLNCGFLAGRRWSKRR